jgi:hypothetical protein
MSPLRFAGVVELAGGMLVPFEIMAYDNTLVCSHMGREDRCSKLSTIHFGYQKTPQSEPEPNSHYPQLESYQFDVVTAALLPARAPAAAVSIHRQTLSLLPQRD